MHRHARHLHRRAARLPALRERDVEKTGSLVGVVVEELVEIAHPVEQQDVRMLALDAQVLLHHGRVGVEAVHRANISGWLEPTRQVMKPCRNIGIICVV